MTVWGLLETAGRCANGSGVAYVYIVDGIKPRRLAQVHQSSEIEHFCDGESKKMIRKLKNRKNHENRKIIKKTEKSSKIENFQNFRFFDFFCISEITSYVSEELEKRL